MAYVSTRVFLVLYSNCVPNCPDCHLICLNCLFCCLDSFPGSLLTMCLDTCKAGLVVNIVCCISRHPGWLAKNLVKHYKLPVPLCRKLFGGSDWLPWCLESFPDHKLNSRRKYHARFN